MGFLRRVWPKHARADKVAFCVTHIGLTAMFFFQLLLVLPKYHETFAFMWCVHVGIGIFSAFQVFSNMYTMILTDTTVRRSTLDLPHVLRPGWSYCHVCQLNAPPRSHHCPVCEVCVIKRDHHCIFTGNCVGFFNHRFFIVFASYLWFGCLYTVIFTKEFYAEVLGEWDLYLVFKFLFPMLVWTTGYLSVYQLSILIVMGVNIFAMLLFTTLIGFQVFFISRGQTQFECKKKVRDYHVNLAHNWRLVLGKRWYLVWFSCWIPSELPGDGKEYSLLKSSCFIENNHLKI